MFDHLSDALIYQVNTRPEQVALVTLCKQKVLSLNWGELAARVQQRADELNRVFDLSPHLPRIVGYSSRNSLGDMVTSLACPFAHAIEAPFDYQVPNVRESFDRLLGGHWMANTQCDLSTKSKSSLSINSIDIDSAALILWTSGTTAKPKGVTLSHRNLCGNAAAKLTAVPQSHEDARLTALPICHAYARTCDLGTWLISGCTLALGLGFDAWQTLGPVVQPTLANTAPSLAARLLAANVNDIGISKLKVLGCGGAAMSSEDFETWKQRGVTVIQGYGLTETSPVICSATPSNASAGLVGDFVDGWEHDIRDGQLFVRSPHVMQGYWSDPQETAIRIDQDGWFDTRDIVERDEQSGQIRILGRIDDVIVLENGRKVHPQAIEKQIAQIGEVRHAMLVADGRDLRVWLDAEPIDDALAKIAKQLTGRPSWEVPRKVSYFDRPLTQQHGDLTGKGTIRRSVLRDKMGQ